MWKLDEALGLIRILQPQTRPFGYHLCLGGGVLNKGESEKDLDLYFLPLGCKAAQLGGLKTWLEGLWGPPRAFNDTRLQATPLGGTGFMVTAGDHEYPDEPPYVFMAKYAYSDLRIDVFILGVEEKLKVVSYDIETPVVGVDTGDMNNLLRNVYEEALQEQINAPPIRDYYYNYRFFNMDFNTENGG